MYFLQLVVCPVFVYTHHDCEGLLKQSLGLWWESFKRCNRSKNARGILIDAQESITGKVYCKFSRETAQLQQKWKCILHGSGKNIFILTRIILPFFRNLLRESGSKTRKKALCLQSEVTMETEISWLLVHIRLNRCLRRCVGMQSCWCVGMHLIHSHYHSLRKWSKIPPGRWIFNCFF